MSHSESLRGSELEGLRARILAEAGPFFEVWMRSRDAVLVHLAERLVVANAACAELFGLQTPEQLLGRCVAELSRAEHLHAVCLLKRGDERSIEVEVSSVPFQWGEHALSSMTLRPSQRSKAMERQLARSDRLLREAQRIAKVGSWELDLESNELFWSDEIFRIFELDPAAFAPSYAAFLERVHPEDRELVNESYERSVREREPYAVVHRLLLQDGRIKYVQERCETFYDAMGKPLRSLGTVQDITAQVNASQTLARERALLQTIVDASPDQIFAKDAQHRFLFVNRAFAAGIHRTPAELVGRPDTDFWPRRECEGDVREGLRGFHDDDRAAMLGHTIHIAREEATFADGMRVLETFKGPLREPSGSIVGSYGYARDITLAERAQRAMCESEQRLNLIFNATKDLVALVDVDPDGRLTVSALNDASIRFFRQHFHATLIASDFLGKQRHKVLADILSSEEIARGEALYRRAIVTRQPISCAIELASPLDGALHLDVTVIPVLDGTGGCTHVLWTARDTTERVRADAALRSSEARYRAVVEDQTEFVCRFRADGQLTFVNDAACRFVGVEREQLLSGSFSRFLPEEDLRLTKECLASLTAEHPVASLEHRVRLEDGRVRWTRWVNRGLFDAAGRLTELQSVGQDITEQHASALRIRKQLEEKEVLLREIHHRVKNNLQVISSLLFLQRERATSEEALESLRESSARVSAMALIHEKLYAADDLARVDMRAYARDLARSLFSTFGITRDRIELDIWGMGLLLPLDQATPYGLILNELVTNALKHAFPSGRVGRIQIGFTKLSDHCELTIGDDGVGAPADVLSASGASLGMRLVSRLLSQVGATIERLARPGTVYQVRLTREQP